MDIWKSFKKIVAFLVLLLCLLPAQAIAKDKLTATTDPGYQPDNQSLEYLQALDRPITIVIIYGGWCPDSQREVPRFMRLLELVNNPVISIEDYEVDRAKTDPLGKAEEYGIRYVPTVIVLEDGRELGRIVETPKMSLEADLVVILKSVRP